MKSIAELGKMTRMAIAEGTRHGQKSRAAVAFEAAEKESARQRADRSAAEAILVLLPDRVRHAAFDGEKYLEVMRIKSADSVAGVYGKLKPDQLCGVGKLVYEACVAAKLDVKLQYGYDSGGMESWNDIVIEWGADGH